MNTDIDIKAIRKALDLTQTELGERLGGLHQGTISRLESGAIKPRGLVRRTLMELQAETALQMPPHSDAGEAA